MSVNWQRKIVLTEDEGIDSRCGGLWDTSAMAKNSNTQMDGTQGSVCV